MITLQQLPFFQRDIIAPQKNWSFIDCIMKHRKLDATKRFDTHLVAAPLFAEIRMHPPKKLSFFSFSKLLVDQSCWGIFVP
jgi:hypothetical protein